MSLQRPLARPVTAAPTRSPIAAAGAAVTATWKAGAAQLSGTNFFFIAYLVLIFVEFMGLPNQYGILKTIRFSTILSYGLVAVVVAKGGMNDVLSSRAAKVLFAFLVFTYLSIFWAVVRVHAVNSVRPIFDYLGLLIITTYLLDRRIRLEWFASTISLVAILLVRENFEKLNAGGVRRGAFKAPYFMGDGNDFAWWLALALPIAFSLVIVSRSKVRRLIGLVGSAACLLGIMGTQSRGAFLGLGAAFFYAWFFVSKKRAVGTVAIVVVAVVMALLAPAGYFARMNTVTEYENDNSAQGRIQAWTAASHMAIDYPLGVGAGNFSSAYGRFYVPSDENNRMVFARRRWISAHSIYFKVLAEYGFIGLGMLFTAIFSVIQHNGQSRRLIQSRPDGAPFSEYWPAFLNMSTIAFAMCGVFLGGFNYPHLFLLTGLALSATRVLRLEANGGVSPGRAPAAPASGGAGRPALTLATSAAGSPRGRA